MEQLKSIVSEIASMLDIPRTYGGEAMRDQTLVQVDYVEPGESASLSELTHAMQRLHSLPTRELANRCRELRISASGTRAELTKRLRRTYRQRYALLAAQQPGAPRAFRNPTLKYLDYLVVIDVECTCERVLINYPHEIIELPAVLVDVERRQVVDEFRTYVRPTINTQLSEFCQQFTGITQSDVDNAPTFVEALNLLRAWMLRHRLGDSAGHRYALVTDGPWDLGKFFQMQCSHSKIPFPHDFRAFVNVRSQFSDFFNRLPAAARAAAEARNKAAADEAGETGERHGGLSAMLAKSGLAFEGHEHSGLDDSRNIAKLVIYLLDQGHELRVNARCLKRPLPMSEQRKLEQRLGQSKDIEERERVSWQINLPYKVHRVTRDDFISGAYADCDSCDDVVDA